MPYFPIAQTFGAFGLPRGPGSYLSLGDSLHKGGFSMATTIALPPGVYAGAPGASAVDARIARTMILRSAHGAGPAGTRGIVDFVPNSQANRTTIVNRFTTPASAIDRTLGATAPAAYGPSVYELPGATRRKPNVPGAKWWNGSGIDRNGYGNATVAPRGRTLAGLTQGLGDEVSASDAQAALMLGKPKGPGEFYSSTKAVWAGGATTRRACEIKQSGAKGACKTFGWGTAQTPVNTGTSNTVYDGALSALTTFYNGLLSGTVPADAPLPNGISTLADPGTGGAGKAAYDSIQSMLGTLAVARQTAQYKQYSAPAYTGGSALPAPTTSNPNPTGAVYTNASGQLVNASGAIIPGYSGAATTYTGQPGTFTPAGGSDPYGSDYANTGLVQAPSMTPSILPTAGGDTALVVNADGSASQTPSGDVGPRKPRAKSSAGLLIGALVIGVGAFAYARRRKKAS